MCNEDGGDAGRRENNILPKVPYTPRTVKSLAMPSHQYFILLF